MFPALELVEVQLRLRTWVSNAISVSAKAGDAVLLTGENGAGKSTLLRAILGLTSAYHGSIRISCHQMAYMTQGPTDFRSLSVADVLSIRSSKLTSYASFAIETLGLLSDYRTPMGLLSGGTVQKAKLLLAIAANPDLLILDEPFASVDAASVSRMIACLEQGRSGRILVLCEHGYGVRDGRFLRSGISHHIQI